MSTQLPLSGTVRAALDDSYSFIMSQVYEDDPVLRSTISPVVNAELAEDVLRAAYLEMMLPYDNVKRETDTESGWKTAVANLKRMIDTLTEKVEQALADGAVQNNVAVSSAVVDEVKNKAACGEKRKRDGEAAAAASDDKHWLVVLTNAGTVHKFDSSKNMVIVGRSRFADVQADNKRSSSVSRVHCVIIKVARYVVVLDLGSYHGVETKVRSADGKPLVRSKHEARNALLFEEGETAVVKLTHRVELAINPRVCKIEGSVCTGYRNYMSTACKHFVCCKACAREWAEKSNTCPMCRAPGFLPERGYPLTGALDANSFAL